MLSGFHNPDGIEGFKLFVAEVSSLGAALLGLVTGLIGGGVRVYKERLAGRLGERSTQVAR